MFWLAAASIGLTAYSTYQQYNAYGEQAQDALDQAYYNKAMHEYNKERIREQAREKAEQIRAAAGRVRGTQMAQQAASGVVIGEGSAAAVLEETNNLAEQDALVALYSGIEGEMGEEQAGRMAVRRGMATAGAARDQQTAALLTGASRIADTAYSYKALKTKR